MYSFYFAADHEVEMLFVRYPDQFKLTNNLRRLSVMSLGDGCYKAIDWTSVVNPPEFTTTASFQLWTETMDGQMRDVNWHFGTVGFGPVVKEFKQTDPRYFARPSADGLTEDRSSISNVILSSTVIEVRLEFVRPVRQHDLVKITIPSAFDTSAISAVYSVFHGEGTVYKANFEDWQNNLFKGVWGEDKAYEAQSYALEYSLVGQELTIYGLQVSLDPRDITQEFNDNRYAVFRILGLRNPRAIYTGPELLFRVQHTRYTYQDGPLHIVHASNDAAFFDDILPGTTTAASCEISNDYSQINSKTVPANLLVFMDFTFALEHPLIEGGQIKIALDGFIQPQQYDVGRDPNGWCFVESGLLPAAGNAHVACNWIDSAGKTDENEKLIISGY